MKSRPNVTTTLGHLADLQAGFPFKSAGYSQSQSGTRLLRGDNIGPGFLRWDNPARWESTDVDSEYELRSGDIVLAMDRPWVSTGLKFARIGEPDLPAYLVQRVSRLRAREGVNQRYLQYVVASSEFSAYVLGVQTGTAVPHISGSQILSYRLAYRPRAEQRAIAEVLGALDDKITANDRAVGLTGDLAKAQFDRLVGGVPLGDAVFGDLAEIGGGGTPRTAIAEYWDGDVAWATPTDVTGISAPYLSKTNRTITDAGLAACSSSLYPTGSILMTSRATIGAFAVAQVPVAVNQGFIVVNAKDPDMQWWLYHEMRARVDEFHMYANGATFLELPRGRFRRLPVRKPSAGIGREFSAVVKPLHELAADLLRQNERLASTRDQLLPLLMSGRLRVKDAERAVEEVL